MRVKPVSFAVSLAFGTLLVACRSTPPGDPVQPGPVPLASVSDAGVARFYELADRLQQGGQPTDADWDALFEAPGYAEIDAVERRRVRFTELVQLAYEPARAADREQHRVAGDAIGRLQLPNLALAIERRDDIEAIADTLRDPEVQKAILARASALLPPGTTAASAPPDLFLIVLDGDCKALAAGLVLDAVGLAVMGPEHTELLIAHEYHHHYRRALDRVELDTLPDDVRPLIRLLERAETEGVADLIDKQPLLHRAGGLPESQTVHPLYGWMWEIYLEQYRRAPEHLAELNSVLELLSGGVRDVERMKSLEIAASRLSARPLGVFVAESVLRNLGVGRVIESVGDPFALFLAYAEAARADDTLPPLSAAACAALRDLQRAHAR